jgi:ribokinase
VPDAPSLVVVGAVNVDLVVRGVPLPAPGQTVTGGVFERHHGGKGGNQAVAAARALRGGSLDGAVRLVGAVGDDDIGTNALEALQAEGVDVSRVDFARGVATGVALIVVDEHGENQIAVAPGANATPSPADIQAALDDIDDRSVVLASLEVPLDAVRRAAERCREAGGTFVLNPAPASAKAASLLALASVVSPNESELRLLGKDAESIRAANHDLHVILTVGSRGAVVDGGQTVPAPNVEAVDATGAGDCLNGVLAAGLLERLPLEEAVARAVTAASISVTRPGARSGMPTRDEIDTAVASA